MERFYTANFNFHLDRDTLWLQSQQPMHNQPVIGDSLYVLGGDHLVVAQVAVVPEDSIDSVWIKLARDQYTMGWTRESEVVNYMVPDDPISEGIHLFSHNHTPYFLAFITLVLGFMLTRRMQRQPFKVFYQNDIKSVYPSAFYILFSASALLYNGIQSYAAESWQNFYFSPSLNPLGQPLILSAFICQFWLLLVMFIATIDEIVHHLSGMDTLLYLASLMVVCMLSYWLFTLLPLLVGVVLYAVSVYLVIKRIINGKR